MAYIAPPPLPRTSRVPRGIKVLLILLGAIGVVVAAFTIWRASLWRDNQSRLNEIAKSGHPVSAADLNERYLSVPHDQNAAVLWMKGVKQMVPAFNSKSDMPWSRLKLPPRNLQLAEPALTENEVQGYTRLVTSNRVALATFRQAASMSQSRYDVDFSRTLMALMPHLPRLRSAVDLLKCEAIVACEKRDAADTVAAVATMAAAGRSLHDEPSTIANLVRFRIDHETIKTTEYIVNHLALDEGELRKLTQLFSGADDMTNLFRVFVFERAAYVTLFQSPRSVGEPDQTDDDDLIQSLNILGSPFVRATGFFDRDLRFYLDAMATNISMATLPDPARFHAKVRLEHTGQRAKDGYYLLSALLLPAMPKVR
jgi:hypothetical protein